MADSNKDIKVLVVDDDPALRGIACAHLRKAGYDVEQASDGEDGLARARSWHPDVIVADVMMPKLDGMGMLKELRKDEDQQQTYIIMLTAKDRTTDMLDGFAASANDYVTKPFKLAEIAARVAAGAKLKKTQDQLQEVNDKLREALTQRAELLGVAVHEIRNPLNIITTYISMLDRGVVDVDTIKEVCLRRAQQLAQIVENILDMTKIDAGLVNLVAEPVNVSKLVDEAAILYGPILKEKNGVFESTITPDLTIYSDQCRVIEIVNTLLENSIRLTPDGKNVSLSLAQEEGFVVFSLTSVGGGMEPEKIADVFDPVIHGNVVPVGYDASTMLGLAIVKKLVELMGGSASAITDGPDKGATFSIRLPRPNNDRLEAARKRFADIMSIRESD